MKALRSQASRRAQSAARRRRLTLAVWQHPRCLAAGSWPGTAALPHPTWPTAFIRACCSIVCRLGPRVRLLARAGRNGGDYLIACRSGTIRGAKSGELRKIKAGLCLGRPHRAGPLWAGGGAGPDGPDGPSLLAVAVCCGCRGSRGRVLARTDTPGSRRRTLQGAADGHSSGENRSKILKIAGAT